MTIRLPGPKGWNRHGNRHGGTELGTLHRREDLPFLNDYAAAEPDPNLAKAARSAAEEIEAFAGAVADN